MPQAKLPLLFKLWWKRTRRIDMRYPSPNLTLPRAAMLAAAVCLTGASTWQTASAQGQAQEVTPDLFRLELRTRVEAFKGSGAWEEMRLHKDFAARETAVIICDLWDNHWCAGATARVEILARKIVSVLAAARARGIPIIHAPSETMDFYRDYPQRRRMLEIAALEPPAGLDLPSPPLPIDDSDGGCDTPGDEYYQAWSRQNPLIPIAEEDVISDDGRQIFGFLRTRGIRNLLVMGVHTNMCVLNRSFAIKQMTKWGIACVLVRDLTDAMYDPKDRPYVAHDEGTELVVQHIEKYWCPSARSENLVNALRRGK